MSAFWFRCYLSPNKDRKNIRHVVATTLGTLFGIFCFGWYSLHFFILVSVCYVIMVKAGVDNIHRFSLVTALGYLSICQISRVYIFDYGLLSTDFSGPLMIITQKITALAFQFLSLCSLFFREKPSLIEYLSYHLNFLSILAGPFISHVSGKQNTKGPVIRKLVICGVSVFLFLTLAKSFPVAHMLNEQSMSKTSFLSRVCYFYIAIQAGKPKYYFAWTIADAVHNAAGYGFSGIDDKGNFRWDLVSNLNIWNIETATSFKMYIDNWNIQTAGWLKRYVVICYDRAPYYPTALTFVLSAVWHGVYPGYYFTFITAIPITMAARAVRNNIRHHFLVSQMMKTMYDIMTWVFTQFAVSYTVMPFILLNVSFLFFLRYMYFHFHIISILVLILLPIKKNPHSIQYHSFHIHVKEKYRTRRIQ
uniref:Membrane bound O-acyltransferase domain containing 1 n=1 Tax=Erpetoichthys calabaricus TaxID=27687 RepID=A0A8C4T4L7_ERPCA